MPKFMIIVASIVLVLHGIVHLLGTAMYLKLTPVVGLDYVTTLLGGRWELGQVGTHVFGVLWIAPALGFVIAGIALLAGWVWWQPVLVATVLFSLVLIGLDWSNAFAGSIVDIAILALVWLAPRIAR
jgi:hypothetical protein